MIYLRNLFSKYGVFVLAWAFIGVAVNTAPPHIPPVHGGLTTAALHSWVQYGISVLGWPLSFWHPVFTSGKWTP
jgi:hypothetical protein